VNPSGALGARYAVCERVLRWGSFAADVSLAREAGIRTIGVDHAAVDAVGSDEAARVLDGEGVGVSTYLALADILTADGSTAPLDDAARRLDTAARLGASGAVVATGPLGARSVADADGACRIWLESAAPLALDRGVRLLFEPVHPLMRHWSYVHTLEHGLALTFGIAGTGVVLDVGHVWWEHDLDRLIRDHVDEIGLVQVTNIDRAALEEVRYERAPLSAGGDVPLAALVAALDAAGYSGWYEDETIARIPRDERLAVLVASREWFESL
jgi:sugar phosphate isomerase/epimerase